MESALPAPASQPPVFERRLHERSEFRNFDLGQRREPSLLFKVYDWAQIARSRQNGARFTDYTHSIYQIGNQRN
jgi:hypothetical protein